MSLSPLSLTRRHFFHRSAAGIGIPALASLMMDEKLMAENGALPGLPHFPPKAKRVIYLHQSGAPSQLDLFDYKPGLTKLHGTELPASVRMGQRITGMTSGQSALPVAKSIFKFSQHGKSGAWLSELLPHTAGIVDDIAIVRTTNTDAINHDPAITFIQTGSQQPGRPSFGAWVSYGLGSENQNLPAFVVLIAQSSAINTDQPLFSRLWGNGFLPSKYQGVNFRAAGDPVLYLSDPPGIDKATRRRMLDGIGKLNEMNAADLRRSRNRNPHRPVRNGVPDADFRARSDGPFERSPPASSTCTARIRASPVLTPPIACWPGVSPNAACVSSSSTSAAGISTTICPAISRCSARAWTSLQPPSYRI